MICVVLRPQYADLLLSYCIPSVVAVVILSLLGMTNARTRGGHEGTQNLNRMLGLTFLGFAQDFHAFIGSILSQSLDGCVILLSFSSRVDCLDENLECLQGFLLRHTVSRLENLEV